MSDPPQAAGRFEERCFEALKALSKAMMQLSLYEATHPSTAEKLEDGARVIEEAVAAGARGRLVFATNRERWLANGRVVGEVKQTGGPVLTLISRFKLSSITFIPGLTVPELTAFCELAASRPDGDADLGKFLAERGIEHIRFNEAVYAEVDDAFSPGAAESADAGAGPDGDGTGAGKPGADEDGAAGAGADGDGGTGADGAAGAGAGGGATPGPGKEAKGATLRQSLQGQTIENSLLLLIRKAVADPAEQAKIFELIMGQLLREIEQKVAAATKLLRTEKTLIESEHDRTKSVVQNSGEGIIVVDGQGRILMMNPAAEAISGATLAESAGKSIASWADDERVVALAADIDASSDKLPSAAIKIEGADGTKRTIRSSWAVVQNEAGRVVGLVMTLTDRAKHRELDKTQREFVANVAHELRSPLSSIQASLDILHGEFEGKLDADQKKVFAASIQNTERLKSLINDILDFSKIESGNMTVFPKRAEAAAIAGEAVESLKPWAARRKLNLSTVADPSLAAVYADPRRTVQVLINLLSNSIKFTPSGGAIQVRAARSPTEPDRWAVLSVADNGRGVPKADQMRLFQKFMQGPSAEGAVAGTGLGLSIAKALVELQGGQIWFESAEGRGTVFHFTLPLYVPPTQEIAATPPPRPWWKRLFGR